jgi:hypothetical protein
MGMWVVWALIAFFILTVFSFNDPNFDAQWPLQSDHPYNINALVL